jgi:hypothetical protein
MRAAHAGRDDDDEEEQGSTAVAPHLPEIIA